MVAAGEARPDDFTPSDVAAAGYSLTIHCAACRVLRAPSLEALVRARPDQPLAAMRFRCGKCGAAGTPFLSWRGPANEHRSFDFRFAKPTGPSGSGAP